MACVLGVGVVTALASTRARSGTQDVGDVPPGSEAEALDIGIDAYVFGYPLVTMEMTRRVMTNVVALAGMHAPTGQFVNLGKRTRPPPTRT